MKKANTELQCAMSLEIIYCPLESIYTLTLSASIIHKVNVNACAPAVMLITSNLQVDSRKRGGGQEGLICTTSLGSRIGISGDGVQL